MTGYQARATCEPESIRFYQWSFPRDIPGYTASNSPLSTCIYLKFMTFVTLIVGFPSQISLLEPIPSTAKERKKTRERHRGARSAIQGDTVRR